MVTANKKGQNITEESPSLKLDVEKLRKQFYSGVLNLSLKEKEITAKGCNLSEAQKAPCSFHTCPCPVNILYS